MEEFSDVRIKQRAVNEFLTAEKVPPIEIHRRMQAVYGKAVQRRRNGTSRFGSQKRSGMPVTASDQLHQDRVVEQIRCDFVEKIIM